MEIKVDIKAKYNYKRIEEIKKRLIQSVGVEEILKNIQGCAIKLEKGHNSDGILVEMVEGSTGKVKGRVYADPNKFMSNGQSYLWFEYFGTGTMAEQPHIGNTKRFLESGYTEWLIPVNKVERALNYPIVTINQQQFYLAHGSKSNHFMGDAEFKTRNENLNTIKKSLHSMLMEVCK